MGTFKSEKGQLLDLTSGGTCYYLQMKILVYPVSIRLVYFAANIGLHPNVLTVFNGLSSIFCLIFFQLKLYSLALLFYWSRTILDYSDGTLARYTNKETKIGGYLDGTIDKLFFIVIWLLIATQISTIIGRFYFLFSCFAYLLTVDFYVMPRLRQLKKRATLKQFFLDRGILIGMGTFIELEFWALVFFTIGMYPKYLLVLVLLNNVDLLYRIYEVLRYYPSHEKK